MTRLVAAEIARLLSRRFTAIALIVLLLGLGAYQLVVNDSLSPATGEQLAAAQRTVRADRTKTGWTTTRSTRGTAANTGGTPEECVVPEPTLADFSADPTPFEEAARTALEVSTVLSRSPPS